MEWIDYEKGKKRELELIYVGSKDGFTCNGFKSKCLNKHPTLVAIKTSNGRRFGGFTT